MTKEDVDVKIEKFVYTNSTRFTVTSKYGAHTCVNQADTMAEAESIAENHRNQLVQLYTPAEMAKDEAYKDKDVSDFTIEQNFKH